MSVHVTTMTPQIPYDPDHNPNVRDVDGIRIQSLEFDAPSGDVIQAYAIHPRGEGPFPAILYVHWYETQSPLSNRSQFLSEGVAWAQNGVVSLHISTAWSQPNWFMERDVERDYEVSIEQAQNIRCALDILINMNNTDPEQIVVVGHDFGAMYGVLAVADDQRPKAFVFMAGTPYFVDWFFYGRSQLPDEEKQAIRDQFAPIDPIANIGRLSPMPIFLQFGKDDFHVPEERTKALFDAAKDPKKIGSYDGGHGLDEHARNDRVLWIAEQLGIGITDDWFLLPPKK